MLDAQYSQPTRNPWRGPKAVEVQTYRPPSSGRADARAMTANPWGMKNASAASTHRKSDEGPLAAASAIQRMPTMAATLKRTISRVLSARSRVMYERLEHRRAFAASRQQATIGRRAAHGRLRGSW